MGRPPGARRVMRDRAVAQMARAKQLGSLLEGGGDFQGDLGEEVPVASTIAQARIQQRTTATDVTISLKVGTFAIFLNRFVDFSQSVCSRIGFGCIAIVHR